MALPGLLIEYLVSGTLALPWILAFTHWQLKEVQNWQLPLLAVGLYVIGMMVDLGAFVLLRPLKWRMRKRIDERLNIDHQSAVGTAAARLVRLMKYSPEIAKEVSARSSRDRIARGVVLNAVLAAVALRDMVPWWIAVSFCLAALGMWLFFESNSYVFELRAEEAILQENARITANNPPKTGPQPSGPALPDQAKGQAGAASG